MMADLFQVKFRGKVVGTATWGELQQQAARGLLTPLHKISPDGIQWRYASEFPEFFTSQAVAAGAAPQPAAAAPQPVPPPAPRAVEWFLAAGDEKAGPFPQQAVLDQLNGGLLGFEDLVWREGFNEWRAIRHVFPREVHALEKQRQKEQARRKREAARKLRPVIPPEQQKYSLLAIASAIFAVLWIFGIGSAVGVVLGFLGLYDIGTSNGYHKGLPFAIMGILLGLLGGAITLVVAFG
jgi:hypothetical protein